jgi:23S rRNA (cytidine1920-2'-O)/16S rRNA (cytidine1409-2'-O)-methyltransferase
VRRGLASTRTAAQRVIADGRVVVGGVPEPRAATLVDEHAKVTISAGGPQWASRGGVKLAGVLQGFEVAVAGSRCLDVGASTGGFTDVLLASGAASVAAVDVGYGQMEWRLRCDPRVTVHDRTNFRFADPAALGAPFDLVVADVSFISLRLLAAKLAACGRAGTEYVVLVKPQFEVGRGQVSRGGLVTDPQLHRAALQGVVEAFAAAGLGSRRACPSPIAGATGNREFFIDAVRDAPLVLEAALAADLVVRARRRGMEVSALPDDARRVPGTNARPAEGRLEADVVVAVGGDGTMLEAVRVAVEADLPVLGVNAGHVGFLTRVEPGRLDAALDVLAVGGWAESRRMTLCALVAGRPHAVGLNDVVVEKAVSQHVVKISVVVGSERLLSYRCDGVVVATPTGSTAYTFSAGGPLVDPELEALVLTAVAPHNLFSRPIVFRPEVALRLTVDDDRPARVNVDGRTLAVLAPGEQVEVRRGERTARFVEPWPRHFAVSVRERFHLHDA